MTAVAQRIFLFGTSAFLLVAPFVASAAQRNVWLAASTFTLLFLAWRQALPLPHPAPRALFAMLLAWCALGAASLAWSVDPEQTANELRAELFYGALVFTVFYCAAGVPARWRAWWTMLVLGSLLLAAAECVRRLAEPALGMREWDGGPGSFSTHLVLVAPLLLAITWPRPWGAGRGPLVLGAAFALLLLAAWETGNRMVWLALFAGFVVALLARRFAGASMAPLHGARGIALAGLAAIALLSLATAWQRGLPSAGAGERITASLQADLRPALWSTAWAEVCKAPWLGHGFGRDIVAPATSTLTSPGDGQPELRHAHNRFLNVALQLGSVGLAVFLVVLALLAREFVLALRHATSAPAGILGLAILCGFLVKNLTDDFWHRHNALVFWALMAMLVGLARRARAAP